MHDQTSHQEQAAHELPEPEVLRAIAQSIADSGALGRSKVYGRLLAYLLEQALEGGKPKEIEIAMEVFGRGADFDVSKDSLVRVYIYQLRKKLDTYYKKHTPNTPYRICIPKGQYALTVESLPGDARKPSDSKQLSDTSLKGFSNSNWMMGFIALLLVLNLVAYFFESPEGQLPSATQQAAQLTPWSALLDDELPIRIVMGDYYIFGELNERGNVRRMVRDFNINSPEDLNELFLADTSARQQFLDLNLNYLPEGSAIALAAIIPVLQKEGKRISVTMMSDLDTGDLINSHIVYIGYISGLDKLQRLVFASSTLQIGRTYDELFNRMTGEIYSSDAGLPQQNQSFRDYGLFSTFPSTSGNQLVIVAGARDAGLMHTARALATAEALTLNAERLDTPTDAPAPSYEALYEVFGIDRQDFDANLVHLEALDPRLIWSGEASRLRSR
ncbi:MAG: hypothetical protein R3332_02365 [Pseudohongiellaceae bacterium]|nr:hypothetical protein [Pseudohongiellaceae bacterium]